MILHKNYDLFFDAIIAASDYYNITPPIIEKDYYVTCFLKKIKEKIPQLLFKGGTSLLKCYKIIDRFSEDIDLTLDESSMTQGNKKKLKQAIIETCDELGFVIKNLDSIRSRRDYNRYEIGYPIGFDGVGIKQYILVETVYMLKAYPAENGKTSSIIYDFFNEIKEYELIKDYNLEPFFMRVQSLERTLIDKVFAICDYMLLDRVSDHSRHIYDLYKLLDKVILDDNLIMLINDVRNDRKQNERCPSAKDNININELLNRIVKENIYKKDYQNITEKLLYKVIKYEEAIKAIEKIIDSKIFE